MSSSRFAMAVHGLALLADGAPDGLSSAWIAGSVNSHAVVLRRLLSRLATAGLIQAREGRGGGYRLLRPAAQITLAEVYEAIETEGPLAPSPAEPNPDCPIGSGMRCSFREVAQRARASVVAALAGETVADVARVARSARAKRPVGKAKRNRKGA